MFFTLDNAVFIINTTEYNKLLITPHKKNTFNKSIWFNYPMRKRLRDLFQRRLNIRTKAIDADKKRKVLSFFFASIYFTVDINKFSLF